MKIHHINCGTSSAYPSQLIKGSGGFLKSATTVCHCLVVVTKNGIVLVDTGYGVKDIENPSKRIGSLFCLVTHPLLNKMECAIEQINELGYSVEDVKHIIPTHLDLDHVGGLSDFPHAKVHVLKDEFDAVENPKYFKEKWAYREAQFSDGPIWVTHTITEKDPELFGFHSIQPIKDIPEIRLIPLLGHTRGHVGVAIKIKSGWLLHAGDAYFYPQELMNPPFIPIGLKLFEDFVTINIQGRRATQKKLAQIKAREKNVIMFCAHDYSEFMQFQKG